MLMVRKQCKICSWFENNVRTRCCEHFPEVEKCPGLKTMSELSDNDIEYAAHVQADSFSYDRSLEVAS